MQLPVSFGSPPSCNCASGIFDPVTHAADTVCVLYCQHTHPTPPHHFMHTCIYLLQQALKTFGSDIAIAFSGAEDVALIEYAHLTGRPYRVFRWAV